MGTKARHWIVSGEKMGDKSDGEGRQEEKGADERTKKKKTKKKARIV